MRVVGRLCLGAVLAVASLVPLSAADQPPAALAGAFAARLVAADREDRYDALAVRELGQAGIAAVLAVLPLAEADGHPRLRAMVHGALAAAARSRGWDGELLRLYDPAGFALFRGEGRGDGQARQQEIAACLAWPAWTADTPDVLVRAAPRPTLAWLGDQAARATLTAGEIERVRLVVDAWGGWIRLGREHQYLPEVGGMLAALFANPALRGDARTAPVLVRALGDARVVAAVPALADVLGAAGAPALRGECALALGRIGDASALAALVRAAGAAPVLGDPLVAARVAEALARWPDEAAAGTAVAGLLRHGDPGVRREAAGAAGASHWAQRAELLNVALGDADGGVVGAALQGVARDPAGVAADAVLLMAPEHPRAPPDLVDALAALRDPRAGLLLAAWLYREDNGAVMVTLVRALAAIGDGVAARAVTTLLDGSVDPLVIEHALRAIDTLAVVEAAPRVVALAEDRSAPPAVRLMAVRALGRFDLPAAHACRARLAADVPAAFPTPAGEDPGGVIAAELVERARIELAVAALRLRQPGAAEAVQATWAASASAGRYALLSALGQTRTDHPLIGPALASHDYAILGMAVRCANAVGAARYRAQLVALRGRPLLRAVDSGVDGGVFAVALATALRAAGETP